MNRTLSGTTTSGQSGPGSDGNERVLRISQSSSITEASPSDCLVSYAGHSLREHYSSAEMQSVYLVATRQSTGEYQLFGVIQCQILYI